jgi:hypothetical protein
MKTAAGKNMGPGGVAVDRQTSITGFEYSQVYLSLQWIPFFSQNYHNSKPSMTPLLLGCTDVKALRLQTQIMHPIRLKW